MYESYDFRGNKGFRLINIYERLNKGEVLNKSELAESYGVTEKTIQRDLDDLRSYLAETHTFESEITIKYDKAKNGYFLVRFEREWLTNEEVLAMCKILMESRAFSKDELNGLISKLMVQVTSNDRSYVEEVVRNEFHNYVPPQHGKKLLATIWSLSVLINRKEITTFSYIRQDHNLREHRVKPVAILFSEFYFYLIAFMADGSKKHPTVFRIDRMSDICGKNEHFSIPYKSRFNDGEFRNRVQFMYSGELQTVQFEYCGPAVESVLDRLPTAKIENAENGIYTLNAEVYGKGIDMWLRSQGDMVNVLKVVTDYE